MRRYGHENIAEDSTRCIIEVVIPPVDLFYAESHQCKRQRGHGEEGLFCRQHSKMKAPTEADND